MKIFNPLPATMLVFVLLVEVACSSLKKCENIPFPETIRVGDKYELIGDLFVMYTLEKEVGLTDSTKYGKRTGELMIKTYEFSSVPIVDKIAEVSLMYTKYNKSTKNVAVGYLNPTRIQSRNAKKNRAGKETTKYNLCGCLKNYTDKTFEVRLEGKKKKWVEFKGTLKSHRLDSTLIIDYAEITDYAYDNNKLRKVVEKPPMAPIEQAYGPANNFKYKNITDDLYFTIEDTIRDNPTPIAWFFLDDSTRFVINDSRGKRVMKIETIAPDEKSRLLNK